MLSKMANITDISLKQALKKPSERKARLVMFRAAGLYLVKGIVFAAFGLFDGAVSFPTVYAGKFDGANV
jgi:hypothetical protein